ncbi:MAG TPA: alkaline phosphatase D family protein [Bryobacteraceae bacterium]|nr:alkaline phosphatase D family protein [Bryobacteraceae bacterium]
MPNEELTRRVFLARTSQYLSLTFASPFFAFGQASIVSNPFTLGIASGDPTDDGVVLWTRLAPDPLNGGGMPSQRVDVAWEVASDERMEKVVKKGQAVAAPNLGHSVHAEVRGLDPDRWYWYRFKAGSYESPIGRTRTAPDPKKPVDKLSFAFASCQHYEAGFFTAYKHIVEEDIQLIVHLGDYTYEGAARPGRPRYHNSPEPTSLSDYRNRHALYKTDPDLQKAHQLYPWIVTWDDHELENNYAADMSEDGAPRDAFLERRANAYQAYYEHMPLRRSSLPKGSSMQLYRRLRFGDLAEFSVLDTRQYRTDQPCGDGNKPQCPEALADTATILGKEQERWFLDGLGKSNTRWNIIAQQVMMAKVDRKPGADQMFAMDQWNGYEAGRNRVLKYLHERKPSNPVVLTGDIHSNWVADLKIDFSDPKSATIGTEFVGTSITSGGDGADTQPLVEAYLPDNPHVRLYNNQRGYVKCSVTPERWQTDYRVMAFVEKPGGGIKTRASFVVENGRPGAERL